MLVFNMHLRKKIVMLVVSLFFIFVVVHIHQSIINDDDPYSIYKQKYYLDGLSHWYNYSGEFLLLIIIYSLHIHLWYSYPFCMLKSSWAISHVNVELRINISYISITRANVRVVNDHILLDMFTRLSNQCLIVLACYAAGGRSQIVRSPIQP